jgi:hypothetical protein
MLTSAHIWSLGRDHADDLQRGAGSSPPRTRGHPARGQQVDTARGSNSISSHGTTVYTSGHVVNWYKEHIKYLSLCLSERMCEKIFFIAPSICRQFCFSQHPPPSPIGQLIGCSWPASRLAKSPPEHSAMSPVCEFNGVFAVAGKSFEKIWEIFKSVYGARGLGEDPDMVLVLVWSWTILDDIVILVHLMRKRQMVLAFFDSKGLIYTDFMPKGRMANVHYITEGLTKFLRVFKQKRPAMAAGDWWFHWDNPTMHTATMGTNWRAARQFKIIQRLPYSPNLAPADFFLIPRVKRKLTSIIFTQETLKKEREGAMTTLLLEHFVTAFWQWNEHCKKVMKVISSCIEKTTNPKMPQLPPFF